MVLDTRDPIDFANGHLIGSINVELAGRYVEFAGGVIQPGARIVLVTDPGVELESKIRLGRIGYDNVLGYLAEPLGAFSSHPDDVEQGAWIDVPELTSLLRDRPKVLTLRWAERVNPNLNGMRGYVHVRRR